ncbi:MAG: DNA polymerase III subunit alpha [Anaerolineae bacterium]|jgi:DNA-directed DNA polymerase III PolC
MSPFAHLHVHSYYSLLDGCASPADLARAAAQAGMPALALTDHNALYGAIEFYDACYQAGLKPILGMELSLDLGMQDLPSSVVLLAQDLEGYANLCRLSSALQTGPDREASLQRGLHLGELEGRMDGLIVLSGGKQGLLDQLLRAGHREDAEAVASGWAERVGRDRFFVELQIQTPDDLGMAKALTALGRRLGLATVATNNVHYLHPDDVDRCQLLAAMNSLQSLAETPSRPNLHLASPEELAVAFAGFPEALANAAAIAGRCQVGLPLGSPIFPEIDLPPGRTPEAELRRQALGGAAQRYGDLDERIHDRLDREIATIEGMGYTPLFLIVADIVRYAKEQAIPVNLRGSAAGSLVAYCLGLSAVDPLALGLYFERFLNPGRRDPPDIDLDICSRRREEVIRYVYHRFGQERVATICTYARLRARSAWREVAKAYRLPQARIDAIAKQIPRRWHPGMGSEIEEAKERLLATIEDGREGQALRAAWALDGHPRHLSVHPGGVVIAPGPLTDLVPLQRAAKGVVITQYDLTGIERLGLVKIDLLGIRALTVVADSVESAQSQKPGLSATSIPDGDPATGELLARAATIGCFQIESPGMRRTLRELGTRTLEDLTVTLALFKPGPLRGGLKDAFVQRHRGKEPVRYLHPSLQTILESTYGVILYQEQVLRIAHELAGFTLEEADQLRRAIAHLGHGDEMVPLRDQFLERIEQGSGIPPGAARRLWDMMFSFAGYGFLKAHAASYAAVSYQTAYLKANFPAEFMTAILRSRGGYYPQRIYLGEARRLGLILRPPHINQSGRTFKMVSGLEGQAVLWMGLGQIRELTRRTMAEILQARRDGPFASLDDLLQRARPRQAEAENLVKAGALDGLGSGRKAMLAELESRKPGAPLQLALPWARSEAEDDTELERLALEVEMLGWPVSTHALAPFAGRLAEQGVTSSDRIAAQAGRRITVAGARMGLWRENRGRITLEDETGLFSARLPGGRKLASGSLGRLGPYLIRGQAQIDGNGEPVVIAESTVPL